MATKRATFDPSFGGHDARLATVLQPGEVVTSSSFGALLLPFSRPIKAKVYVTSFRLAAVPDDVSVTSVWSQPWNQIDGVRVKKSLVSATAFIAVDGSELGVDSTKAMAGDIERAWLHLRSVSTAVETCGVEFLPSVDVRCAGCGSQVSPASPRCGKCLRTLSWPAPLSALSAEVDRPGTLLPDQFPNGDSTQRDAVVHGLAVLVVGAACTGQTEFLANSKRLVEAIRDRQVLPPESFGDLPMLRGVGEQDSNEKFWRMVCRYPERLAGR